jgi:DNA-binding Lrp family transcriptional regulator
MNGQRAEIALAYASAGYRVIPLHPLTKRRRTRKGTRPSRKPGQIRVWFEKLWPDAEIGVVLDDSIVVVLDLDGFTGADSLRHLLDLAGLPDLPETYTVVSGREGGGWHLWFKLPRNCPRLKNQCGSEKNKYADTPKLDVLFNGLVVAAGSLHKSGRRYTATTPQIPRPWELAELPMELYRVLANRASGSLSSGRAPRRRRARYGQQGSVDHGIAGKRLADTKVKLARNIREMLQDTSDGRNHRCLEAVTFLAKDGHDDAVIHRTLLGSPLGEKAKEQSDPEQWIQDKIDVAREFIKDSPVFTLDKEQYRIEHQASGASPTKRRIIAAMLDGCDRSGQIRISQAALAHSCAVGSVDKQLKELIHDGWLIKVTKPTIDKATKYQLVPRTPPSPSAPKGPTTPHHHTLHPIGGALGRKKCRSFPRWHDAFRPGKGTLHSTYGELAVLDEKPQVEALLAERLGYSLRQVRTHLRTLEQAGLALRTAAGWILRTLTPAGLVALLDRIARSAGTIGTRDRVIKAYLDRIKEWKEVKAEAGVAGSEVWRKITRKHYVRQVVEGYHEILLQHYGGDIDVVTDSLVDYECRVLTRNS